VHTPANDDCVISPARIARGDAQTHAADVDSRAVVPRRHPIAAIVIAAVDDAVTGATANTDAACDVAAVYNRAVRRGDGDSTRTHGEWRLSARVATIANHHAED
jgi:hypothetical protein